MKLDKILIIDDDVDDALAIKRRLKNVDVDISSQAGAQHNGRLFGYDLVVLNNDANNMSESKGKVTLAKIADRVNCPIIYTSAQPGWVDPVVSAQVAKIVPTFELVDTLKADYNLQVRPSRKPKTDGTLTLLTTYNSVTNYEPGVVANKLLIVTFEKQDLERFSAKEIIAANAARIFGKFNWQTDRDMIRNIFVYDGFRSQNDQRHIAAALGHDVRMKVNLLACSCNWSQKSGWANSMYADLWEVNCGGSREMGIIADHALAIKRPDVDYSICPVPVDVIKRPGIKYRI